MYAIIPYALSNECSRWALLAARLQYRGVESMTNARILVADDDPLIRRLLVSTLQDEGYEVLSAANGIEVVEQANARTFDAIILDLQMPDMDGREAYEELQRLGISTPTLIISAQDAHGARKELKASGAIEKPFDPPELARRVARMLANAHGHLVGNPIVSISD